MIDTWISADQDSWFPEGRLVLIGKSTRAESASDGLSSGVVTELEDGTLTLSFTRDNHNVLWVLDGSNGTGSQHDLFPGLAQVENVVLGSRSLKLTNKTSVKTFETIVFIIKLYLRSGRSASYDDQRWYHRGGHEQRSFDECLAQLEPKFAFRMTFFI